MSRLVLLIASICWTLSCSSERPQQRRIGRQDMGTKWPLTVDSGTLTCEKGAVVFEADGKKYAVNGTAETRLEGRNIELIWAPGDPVWVTDPNTKQLVNVGPRKKNTDPLIDAGLQLCAK